MANDVFLVLREPNYFDERRTIIVLGAPRGGTSMIAGSLRLLGVYMGDNLGDQHEDPDFSVATSVESKIMAVAERNKKYIKWGWKLPDSIYYIDAIMPSLVNPCFIAVFRNPLSVAKSSSERDATCFDASLIGHPIFHYGEILRIISRYSVPTALVCFESALAMSYEFGLELSKFSGVSYDDAKMGNICHFVDSTKGYQDLVDQPTVIR